jgi:hypothetical protein
VHFPPKWRHALNGAALDLAGREGVAAMTVGVSHRALVGSWTPTSAACQERLGRRADLGAVETGRGRSGQRRRRLKNPEEPAWVE